MLVPDGYLTNGLLVFPEGYVSKGFELTLPERSQGRPEMLNSFQECCTVMLNQLPEGCRIQIQSDIHSNFPELDNFDLETQKISNQWVRGTRLEKLQAIRALMAQGKLRRKRSRLYISRRWEGAPGLTSVRIESACTSALAQYDQEFRGFGQNLARQLASHAVAVLLRLLITRCERVLAIGFAPGEVPISQSN